MAPSFRLLVSSMILLSIHSPATNGKNILASSSKINVEKPESADGSVDVVADDSFTSSSDANAFVDQLLEDVESKIRDRFDPAPLPEGGFGFEKKILFVTVKGEMKFYDGWLVGLSTLHRVGNSRRAKDESGGKKIVEVASTLGIGNLVGQYKAHAKFMNIGPSFEVTVTVPEVSLEIAVQQHLHVEGSMPLLTHFDILRVGKVDVKIKGSLGILNWTLNKVASFIANLVKNFVLDEIEFPIRQLISDQLKNSGISLDGI